MPSLKNHIPLFSSVFLGLAAIVLVIFVSPSRVFPAPPIISWTPNQVTGEVALGNSKTISVTFTSSKKIRRAAVEISPQLASFVRVTPAFLERIRRGESRQVQLVFSAAATSSPGTINGTIQLRKGKKEKGDKPEDDDDDVPEGKLLVQPLPVILTVTVVPLPPDPGEAGKATLGGIDSDRDGVRDDIERYIALTYPTSEKTRASLTQFTLAIQESVLNADDKDKSLASGDKRMAAMSCLMIIRGVDGSRPIWDELRAQLLNTVARSRAYIKASAQLSGQVYRENDAGTSPCNFDPSTMGN